MNISRATDEIMKRCIHHEYELSDEDRGLLRDELEASLIEGFDQDRPLGEIQQELTEKLESALGVVRAPAKWVAVESLPKGRTKCDSCAYRMGTNAMSSHWPTAQEAAENGEAFYCHKQFVGSEDRDVNPGEFDITKARLSGGWIDAVVDLFPGACVRVATECADFQDLEVFADGV